MAEVGRGVTDDAGALGDRVDELTVFFRTAELEHVLNAWLRAEIPVGEVLLRLGALRQEVELLALMNQGAKLELAVRLSPAPAP